MHSNPLPKWFICKMILTTIKRFLVTDDFFDGNLKFLFLSGLWPNENFTYFQSKLYKAYEFTLTLFMVVFFIITGIKFAECSDVISLLTMIDKSIVSYNFFFKVICFFVRRKQLKSLIHDIVTSGDRVTDKNRDDMIKLMFVITIPCLGTLTIFTLMGIYNNEMTMEAWMPFNPYESKMNLILSGQVLAVLYTIPFLLRAMSMQGMVCSLLIYLCDQLKELQKRIYELKYTKERETIMRKELIMIVKKHIRLVRYANFMKILFKEYFLIQNFSVALELCVNAVLLTAVTRDQISVVFGFASYLAIALMNAYIYCSLGNNLIVQGKNIAAASYASEWTSWPVDLQKTVLLIITVAQRDLVLSAGGIAKVDLQNYANALYNGYSIFAVLNDVVN